MTGPASGTIRPKNRDELDREAMERVAEAVRVLNDSIRLTIERKIRVEIGTVGVANSSGKVARDWRRLWTEDGLAVRFTREEIAVAPAPEPPVTDGQPGISE
jgi:hypothetical protein